MYACVHACFCRARGWGSNRGHWALHDKQRVCVGDGTPPSWTSVSPSVREGAGWKPPGNPRFPGLKLTLQVAGGRWLARGHMLPPCGRNLHGTAPHQRLLTIRLPAAGALFLASVRGPILASAGPHSPLS